MKNTFFLVIVSMCFWAQSAFAVDNICQKGFGEAVSACAQNIQNLAPEEIPGAQKACVDSAKAAKEACLAGSNQCSDTCQTNLNITQLQCQADYNTDQCAGSPTCILVVTNLLNNCLSEAQITYDSCFAGCYQ